MPNNSYYSQPQSVRASQRRLRGESNHRNESKVREGIHAMLHVDDHSNPLEKTKLSLDAVREYREKQKALQRDRQDRGRFENLPNIEDQPISGRNRFENLRYLNDEEQQEDQRDSFKDEFWRQQLINGEREVRGAIHRDQSDAYRGLRAFYNRDPELGEVFERRGIQDQERSFLDELLTSQRHQDEEFGKRQELSNQEGLRRLNLSEALGRPNILDEYQEGLQSIDQQHDYELKQLIERRMVGLEERGQRQNIQREAKRDLQNFYDRASLENDYMRGHPINTYDYRSELRNSIENDTDENVNLNEFMTDPISTNYFWEAPQQGVFRTQGITSRADGYEGQTLQGLLNASGVRNQFNDPFTRAAEPGITNEGVAQESNLKE